MKIKLRAAPDIWPDRPPGPPGDKLKRARARTKSGSRSEEVFARFWEALPGRRALESYNI